MIDVLVSMNKCAFCVVLVKLRYIDYAGSVKQGKEQLCVADIAIVRTQDTRNSCCNVSNKTEKSN